MNKTALLIGAMVLFLLANVFMLTFLLNRSQQSTAGGQLVSTDAGTTQPGTAATGDADAAATSSGGGADPAAFKAAMDIGKTEYVICAACHGADGKGLKVGPQLMAPSLVGSQIALGDPDRAALVVLKGIKKETNDYVGLMAPLPFEDEPLASVLTYVRNSFGNSGSLIEPAEVAAARARFASVPALVSRGGIDSLLASNPKVATPAAGLAVAASQTGATAVATTSAALPPVVKEPWVPIPGIKVVGGRVPDERPENAPLLSSMDKDGNWYSNATRGINGPFPSSLEFLEDQGRWYTPFDRPGMTGPYDIRNWHIDE